MGNLSAFLHPAYTEKSIEVVIGDRFLDEEGNPVPFKLKSISQERIQYLAKRATKEVKVGNKKTQEIDRLEFVCRCLVESCTQPDFKSHDICEAYCTEDPVQVPTKMLLADEFETLSYAFMKLNGLNDEDALEEAVGEITKN